MPHAPPPCPDPRPLAPEAHPTVPASGAEAELPLGEVSGRAVRATGALMGRQVVVRLINLVGFVVLARLLDPGTFGIFAVVRFVVYFLGRVSDAGLSATLLRKAEAVTEAELRTVFTIQQAAVAVAVTGLWIGAPWIAQVYPELGPEHVWLLRVLGIGLVLASLRTIPRVLIQRALRHDKLAVIDVAEVVAYYVVTVGLAAGGLGVWALVWGTLARGLVATLGLLSVAWWRPGFAFDRETAREVLRFGVPIQLASFVTLAKESVVPVLVLSMFGPVAVGVVNWARTLADSAVGQPLTLMGKVQLRVFGRIQGDRQRLRSAVERSVSLGAAIVAFPAALVLAQSGALVEFVVGEKWVPALPLLYLLTPAFLLRIVGSVYQQALKAVGEGVTMLVNASIMFVTQGAVLWLLAGPVARPLWERGVGSALGVEAYAVAFFVSQALVVMHAAHRLRRYARPRWGRGVAGPLAAGSISAAAMWGGLHAVPNPWAIVPAALLGAGVYTSALGLLAGRRFGREVRVLAHAAGSGRAAAWADSFGSALARLDARRGGSDASATVPTPSKVAP